MPLSLTERPGLEVSRAYFTSVVRPLLSRRMPQLDYAAARIGPGSDVLGLDDATSRDHDWGLRLQLFVQHGDLDAVATVLEADLPEEFGGLPVRFAFTGTDAAHHHVEVLTVAGFAERILGFDPRPPQTPQVGDWLSLSGQAALEVTAGEVFADTLEHELGSLRDALAWYPDAVWRYLIASAWREIDEGLPLMSRAGHRGDDLGSRIIAGRLSDTASRLAFLLHRSWLPYPKWRGTLLTRLPAGETLRDATETVLAQDFWGPRQQAMEHVLAQLGQLQQQALNVAVSPVTVPFYERPYLRVSPGLVPAVEASITDPAVAALPLGLGGVEQLTDNVMVLTDPARRRQLVDALVCPPG